MLFQSTIPPRFWRKVYAIPNGCWLWTGCADQLGYGFIYDEKLKRQIRAHRFSYELFIGPIQKGLTLDHLCRVPRCVNPLHLEAVPHRINVLRGIGPTAKLAQKTHCLRGHPLDLLNTIRHKGGRRGCRECQRLRNAQRPTTTAGRAAYYHRRR